MKIQWTNKVSREQGFVKTIHTNERYFENTFEKKEAKNFPPKAVGKALEQLNDYCPDNTYQAV